MKRLLRSLAILIAAVMVGSGVVVLGAANAEAAAFSVSTVKWAKSSVDTSLVVDKVDVKLTVKTKNAKKGANAVQVTIQNSKTKKKMTTRINSKNGGTAYFAMDRSKKNAGTWKVTSVKSVKVTKKATGWVSGKWLGGKWIAGYQGYKYTTKSLSTAKLTAAQKRASLKVTRGKDTKLTLSSVPTSQYASKGTVKVKAVLKDDKGKPVKGAKVKFVARPGLKGKEAAYGQKTTTIKTNSKGIAQGTIKVPQEPKNKTSFLGFGVTAVYAGQAKKYVSSWSPTKYVKQPKEPVKLNSTLTWDGHTGSKSFKMSVVSTVTNKPAKGVPLNWEFQGSAGASYKFSEKATTNSKGVATVKVVFEPSDWMDWKIKITGGVGDSPYRLTKSMTKTVKKKQSTVKYALNTKNITLLNGNGNPWLKETGAAGRSKIYLYGSPGVVTVAGTKAAPKIWASVKSGAFTYSVTALDGEAKNTVVLTGGKAYIKKDENNKFVLALPSPGEPLYLGNPNPGLTDVTKVKITLKPAEFKDSKYPEYRYVPSSTKEVSFELSATK